ncbi:hypothetical protein [Leisingera caerulea]|uniref:hypothetical protein n=1 Tax=Leisingera caerulea TaxID=506591 RepID=UPI001AE035D8|nr:hypothetical protein [Leisingera caerulea]
MLFINYSVPDSRVLQGGMAFKVFPAGSLADNKWFGFFADLSNMRDRIFFSNPEKGNETEDTNLPRGFDGPGRCPGTTSDRERPF